MVSCKKQAHIPLFGCSPREYLSALILFFLFGNSPTVSFLLVTQTAVLFVPYFFSRARCPILAPLSFPEDRSRLQPPPLMSATMLPLVFSSTLESEGSFSPRSFLLVGVTQTVPSRPPSLKYRFPVKKVSPSSSLHSFFQGVYIRSPFIRFGQSWSFLPSSRDPACFFPLFCDSHVFHRSQMLFLFFWDGHAKHVPPLPNLIASRFLFPLVELFPAVLPVSFSSLFALLFSPDLTDSALHKMLFVL